MLNLTNHLKLSGYQSVGGIWLRVDKFIWIPTNPDQLISQWWSETVLAGYLDDMINQSFRFRLGKSPNEDTVNSRRMTIISIQARLSGLVANRKSVVK